MNSPNGKKSLIKEGWKKRFYNATIQWILPARNEPHRILLVSNESGKFELHTRDLLTGFSRQLTKRPDGTLFGSISPDGRYVYFLNDKSGDEHGHFIRIPFSGGRSLNITPHLPRYFSYGVSANNKGDLLNFTASISNENRIYLVSFDVRGRSKTPRLIYKSSNLLQESLMSPNGEYTCLVELYADLKSPCTVILINNLTGRVVHKVFLQLKNSFTPLAFSSDTLRKLILGITNASGFYRPIFVDLDKDVIKRITNKNFRGDVFVLSWDEKERTLLLCDVHEARHQLFLYNIRTRKTKRIGPVSGGFDLFFNSAAFLANKSIITKWNAFGVPPRILKLIPPTYKKSENIYAPSLIVKPKRTFESIWFRSSDKQKVQMWVAWPSTRRNNLPFVIDIHGGPHGVVNDEFSPEAHAWLDYGFGYCAVNYRGSIGFGKDFEEKIYGNPGNWEVKDVIAARNWLIKKGWANPNRIILSGWSWGGYITLLALGKYPKLWMGGIAGMPIADFFLQYEDEPAFLKAIDRKRFGGTPAEVPQRYTRSSPATYIKNIQTPILIIHGKNDARCPPRQILYFEKLMKKEDKSITVRWFSSGHAGEFANTKIRVSNLTATLKFAINLLKKNPSKS